MYHKWSDWLVFAHPFPLTINRSSLKQIEHFGLQRVVVVICNIFKWLQSQKELTIVVTSYIFWAPGWLFEQLKTFWRSPRLHFGQTDTILVVLPLSPLFLALPWSCWPTKRPKCIWYHLTLKAEEKWPSYGFGFWDRRISPWWTCHIMLECKHKASNGDPMLWEAPGPRV